MTSRSQTPTVSKAPFLGEAREDNPHWIDNPPFRWKRPTDENSAQGATFVDKYALECFCKRDVKICHCGTCKKLHGAPMQTAAIFHETDARLTKGDIGDIFFFSPSLPNSHVTLHATPCPRKIYCASCGSPLADEGKNMFIAYPSSIHRHKSLDALSPKLEGGNQPQEDMRFGDLPPAFNVQKHIFYGQRSFELWDSLEKWEGLDGKSKRMADDGSVIE